MQQGRYPVGYLLLWQNGLTADRAIGTDAKQKPPRLVIVDGQQRLTSLYAVVKGVPVVRYNYDSEQIRIAFNPLEERFEVHDAAIQRDKSFIPDISSILSGGTSIFKVARNISKDCRPCGRCPKTRSKAFKTPSRSCRRC